MIREITSHKVNGLNELLKVEALDEPGPGNASHLYAITYGEQRQMIAFQNGPLQETGGIPNGGSIEALLAICEDRLLGFQSGKFACRDNAVALTKIQEAMMWLQKRTRERMARGVEGTLQK